MRSRFNTNNCKTDLDNVVSAEVEGGEGGGVAEGGARQTPDVVICQVEDLELAQPLQGLLPQLQGHGARPFAVVSLQKIIMIKMYMNNDKRRIFRLRAELHRAKSVLRKC